MHAGAHATHVNARSRRAHAFTCLIVLLVSGVCDPNGLVLSPACVLSAGRRHVCAWLMPSFVVLILTCLLNTPGPAPACVSVTNLAHLVLCTLAPCCIRVGYSLQPTSCPRAATCLTTQSSPTMRTLGQCAYLCRSGVRHVHAVLPRTHVGRWLHDAVASTQPTS